MNQFYLWQPKSWAQTPRRQEPVLPVLPVQPEPVLPVTTQIMSTETPRRQEPVLPVLPVQPEPVLPVTTQIMSTDTTAPRTSSTCTTWTSFTCDNPNQEHRHHGTKNQFYLYNLYQFYLWQPKSWAQTPRRQEPPPFKYCIFIFSFIIIITKIIQ